MDFQSGSRPPERRTGAGAALRRGATAPARESCACGAASRGGSPREGRDLWAQLLRNVAHREGRFEHIVSSPFLRCLQARARPRAAPGPAR